MRTFKSKRREVASKCPEGVRSFMRTWNGCRVPAVAGKLRLGRIAKSKATLCSFDARIIQPSTCANETEGRIVKPSAARHVSYAHMRVNTVVRRSAVEI